MSTEKDKLLKALRPIIQIEAKENISDFELFQNNTLRQICKFQNDLFLVFINEYIVLKKKTFFKHAPADKLLFIDSLFAKDTSFKSKLRGFVIGHFTNDEMKFYTANISEIDKRITQLIKTRFLSQFEA